MGDGNYRNWFACWIPTTTSSSNKLVFFIVPLILVSFFVFILVPKNSTWVVISSLPPSSSSSSAASAASAVVSDAPKPVFASNSSEKIGVASHAEESEGVNLSSKLGTVHGSLEEAAAAAVADEAELNRSASPPLALDEAVTKIPEFNETREDGFNISLTGTPNATMNESIALPVKQSKRVRTKLDKLEAGLQKARAAIKEAKNGSQLQDRDYVPIGPMYWDAKAFHRSYLEMEKQFKIFVYKEGEPPVFHDGPCKSIYSMEGNFIHQMDIDSKFQTNDPEKAHVFYLPFSIAKMVQFVYLRDSRDFSPIRRTVVDYVNLVAQKYPYWNRSLGADHFMVACHDWGPEASFSLPYLGRNSIRALCNANTSEKFNPVKDVSIPEINLQTGKLTGLIGGPSPSRRPILAFFAGGVHGPIRPILLEHWEGKDEDIRNDRNEDNNPNITLSSENFNFTTLTEENESNDFPSLKQRVRTNLDRLEDGLQRARAAIKEAANGSQLEDPDYIPDGPIYRNAKVFHRSYLEMEKQFKIFVYKEGDLPLFHDGPCSLSYSMEGHFINKMEINKKFRTKNPEKAHVFYLPYSVTRLVQYNWVKGTRIKVLGGIILDYVNVIAGKYPFWNRSLGADHFMLSCHDWGPATSFFVPDLAKNSIRALCNANTSERFNPMKDVSIPEISIKTFNLEVGLIGGLSPSQRRIFAFFAGGNHGPVRPILFEHWEKKDPDIRVHSYLPKGVSYYDLMRQTKYCLCPSGYEVASPRVVESLYNGCVPVLISKTYVPPFSDVLNWKMFSVMVSLEDIPNLKKILMSIPDKQYIRMLKRGVQVRRHFELHATPKREHSPISISSNNINLDAVPKQYIIMSTTLASQGSKWGSIYTLSTSSSAYASLDSAKNSSLHAKESENPADLHSNEVATAHSNSVSTPIVLQFNDRNEDSNPNITLSSENFNSTTLTKENESNDDFPPLKPRVRTNLDRLEDGLQRARAAIKEAANGSQLQDPDYIPDGPIYRNAKVFHRSYLEMEKQFKIYVYKEGDLPLFHDGPCTLLYSMEGHFINKMEINKKFRTQNPEKAHVFYLPYSVTRLVQYNWVKGTHFQNLGGILLDYVNVIAGKYPFWNRSLGADHFMLSCHDWGPATSFYVPDLAKNSIRALCNANTSERFNPMKDVSIPEISLKTFKLEIGLIGGLSPSQRRILAFFAGGNHGPVRPILFQHWEKKDHDIRVHSYLRKGVSYYDLMRQSKYCLCPSGYEVASPRVVESLYNGCVPVLISKSYVPPFSDVLNWKMFSVMVSLEDIPNLKKILMSIPDRQYIRMQKRGVQVRRHFELHATPKRFDVFHMILHSIWLRRLNVRIGNDPGEILD
ncbi:Exostosin-like protein [Corchorus capsularis]|uniref:Exostosin-like protein n=1 Tax=Corchorus capsularis TaxID=210143 RepID=A0A1R3IHC0_COCAP|nr:Exostosin-like protein [Corchorus capsularis]